MKRGDHLYVPFSRLILSALFVAAVTFVVVVVVVVFVVVVVSIFFVLFFFGGGEKEKVTYSQESEFIWHDVTNMHTHF